MTWPVLILAAYLAGSIPFGLILGRMRGVDIREHGSKNIGATNVGRVLGRKLGLLCFVLDLAKGAVPVLVAGGITGMLGAPLSDLTQGQMWLWLAVAASAVIGHMASVFLGFKGGKGVATGCGALGAIWPGLTIPVLAALVVWMTTFRATRYVSVASMAAAVALPIATAIAIVLTNSEDAGSALLHASPLLIVTTAMTVLVIWRHRTNITRLRRGEEPKVGSRPKHA